VSDEESHYDVLGVEPSATKDEIRDAYRERLADAQAEVTEAETAKRPEGSKIAAARAEESRVRNAWQVLSDPMQRERHDTSLGVEHDPDAAVDELSDDEDETSVALTPREQRAQARREAAATTRDGRPRPPGLFSTERPPTPPSWPPGLHAPPPRGRLLAMVIDLVVVAVIFAVVQIVGGIVIDDAYPKETARIEHLADCLDRLESANDDLDSNAATRTRSIERANTECGRFAAISKTYGEPLSTESKDKQLENQIDNRTERLEDDLADAQGELVGPNFARLALTLLLAVLYLVPSTLRSGRTLGKKLMQVRLVNADGSAVMFRGAMIHYGLPIFVALFFGASLGQIGLFIYVGVLFAVLTWPRNANYQGLHDRLAGTIVVDG
jgi:uncharacterized RDD family membrane protein YckC